MLTEKGKEERKDYSPAFEIAVLNNLSINTVEEAEALVPTLKGKLDSETIEAMLADLARFQA